MNPLSLAYIFTFLVLDVTAGCPELYMRYSEDHTYCKPADPNCKIVTSSVSQEDKETILDEHNILRSKLAIGAQENLPPASDMLQMVWDDELADIAQKHANLCQFEPDCDNCRRVQNFGVGQNLASETLPKDPLPTPNWRVMIKSWYDEVQFFDDDYISPFVPSPEENSYGHFSQVVWASSWRVGCGYSLYEDGEDLRALYTCNYGPGGNTDEATMYQEGEVCSACPLNSCCDDTCVDKADYHGLCKITDTNGPTYESSTDYFFYCDFQKQSDCEVDIKGDNKWQTHTTLTGNYLSIVLDGGEESKIIFDTHLKPKTESFCFVMNYRRGPNVDGDEDSSTLTQTFTIVASDYKLPNDLGPMDPELRHDFTEFSMSLGWSMETEVEVEFSVPKGEPKQYFEIQSVYATEGECQQ